ncbi:hypothetical protein POREN0001_0003 [Porphyromonas endodontalis ATCC 35406]|uniref:Uncharacterized protein n=1 Tax=Porphyromonas endodontalis (strain ATCC 35406 / DSM 24491 / JCM 8526 / CCUG 16442 / BCRC 14492 / NCTC 13058 / HG 370) TaxID=553175 RepID=C3J8H3_POREA|nr:hypothetical protein POREN0001_0003 [Porphyromonas endodontalis ATCC 35406]
MLNFFQQLYKTEKMKSTKEQNEKYRINKSKQQNEKYKGGAKNTRHLLFFTPYRGYYRYG